MGRKAREHRLAVMAGREPPFRQTNTPYFALKCGNKCHGKVAVSGYRCDLNAIYNGWRRFDAGEKNAHSVREECLWMNY